MKYKIGDYVRVSRNSNIFKKGYESGWSEEIFRISHISPLLSLYYIEDLNGEKIQGGFYTHELQKIKFNINKKKIYN